MNISLRIFGAMVGAGTMYAICYFFQPYDLAKLWEYGELTYIITSGVFGVLGFIFGPAIVAAPFELF